MTSDARLFDEGEGLFEVNPSKLQCYLDCPRQYRYRYVERRTERRSWAHTALGRSVHKALRDFYGLPGEDRTLDVLLRLLRRAWDASGYRSPTEAEDGFARAEDMLRRYHATTDHARVRAVALESKFSHAHVQDRILVTGRVDRLDLDDSGYVIVDYKTGSYRQDERSIHASLPLSLYAIAASAQLGSDVARIRLEHLAAGGRAETRRDPDRLAEDWRSLVAVVEEIRAQEHYDPTPGPLCRWCDYLWVCDEGRATVNSEEPARRTAPWTKGRR